MKTVVLFVSALVLSGCVVTDGMRSEEKELVTESADTGPEGANVCQWRKMRYVTDSGVKKSYGFFPGASAAGDKAAAIIAGSSLVNVFLLFTPTIWATLIEPFSEPDKEPGKDSPAFISIFGMYHWRDYSEKSYEEMLEKEDIIDCESACKDQEGKEVKTVCGAYLSSPGCAKLKEDVESGASPQVVFDDPYTDFNSSVRVRKFKKSAHVEGALAFVDGFVWDEGLVGLFKFRHDCQLMCAKMSNAMDRVNLLCADFPSECGKLKLQMEEELSEMQRKSAASCADPNWLKGKSSSLALMTGQLDILDSKKEAKAEAARIAAEKEKARLKVLEEEARKVARADLRKRRGDFKGMFGRRFGEVVDVEDGTLVADKQGRHFYRVPFQPKNAAVLSQYYLWVLPQSHRVCGIEGRRSAPLEGSRPELIEALENKYGEKFTGDGSLDDGYWELDFPEEGCLLSVVSSGKSGAGFRIFSTLALAAIFGTRGAPGAAIAKTQEEAIPKIQVADFKFTDNDSQLGTVLIAIDKKLLGESETEYARFNHEKASEKKDRLNKQVMDSF